MNGAGLPEDPLQILNQQRPLRQLEEAVDRLPVEPPHRAIGAGPCLDRGEVGGHQRRVGPVEQPGGQAVVLRRDQDLPVVDRGAGSRAGNSG